MTVQPPRGDPGAFGRQVHQANAYNRARGITAIQSQGTPQASKHVVSPGGASGSKQVDDGAHGTHDYGVALHPEAVDRFKAHGARLDEHDARIKRLEGPAKADIGAPGHHHKG